MQSLTEKGRRLLSFGAFRFQYSHALLRLHLTARPTLADGGGPRAISQLDILGKIMFRIQYDRNPNDPDTPILPCDYFDMMGGSDTGGSVPAFPIQYCLLPNEFYLI